MNYSINKQELSYESAFANQAVLLSEAGELECYDLDDLDLVFLIYVS